MQIKGHAIREARLAAGLSPTGLAAAVGVSVDTIERAERGAHKTQSATLARIARVLEVDINTLFDSDESVVA